VCAILPRLSFSLTVLRAPRLSPFLHLKGPPIALAFLGDYARVALRSMTDFPLRYRARIPRETKSYDLNRWSARLTFAISEDAMGGLRNEKENVMFTIGNLSETENGYTGSAHTSILKPRIEIEPASTPFRNKLIHADCLKALPMLQSGSVNFILTDPPYITRYKSRDGRSVPNDDNDAWLKPAFAEMHRVLAPDSFAVSFYGWPQADKFMQAYRAAGFRVVGHLMFPKRYASSTRFLRYQHESAHLLAKGNPRQPERPIADVIEWKYTGNKLHPTEKPVSALTPLVETFSCPQGTVLDPFAGSGSSLMAAKMLGRSYIGIELDATYHAIAARRLAGERPV
jgi:DNA modification methylase